MAKRFVNSPVDVVPDLMQGLSLDSSRVAILDSASGHHVAIRTSLAQNTQSPPRVAVVSGGGSGHEPMAAGYVADGMLAAAVAGGIFASPSVSAITAMLDAVAPRSTGILVVVMNYQGDSLNFGRAVQDLLRRSPNYPIHMLKISDDVALPSVNEKRGIAGSVFVLKVAGAAADQGRPFQEVVNIAEKAAKSVVSFGVALGPCTIPGHAVDEKRLGVDEVELGMGIHGEAGAEKQRFSLSDRVTFTRDLIGTVCARLDQALLALPELANTCTGLAIMVNNLGAVSQAEMLIVCKAVADFLYTINAGVLNAQRHRVHMFSGSFLTSLDMNGISVSCMMLPSDYGFMEQFLHAPTASTAWNRGFALQAPTQRVVISPATENVTAPPLFRPATNVYFPANQNHHNPVPQPTTMQPHPIFVPTSASAPVPVSVAAPIVAAGPTPVPASVASSTLKNTGARTGVYTGPAALSGAAAAHTGLSPRTEMFILTITSALQAHCDELAALDRKTGDGDIGDTADSYQLHASLEPEQAWRAAFIAGTNAVMKEGGADIGDRTLVDALKPAADVLARPESSLPDAAQAARVGCESTKSLTSAKFGRSTYVRAEKLLNEPDPGALAITIILDAMVSASS